VNRKTFTLCVAATLIAQHSAYAAFSTYEFYDLEQCVSYSLTDEPLFGDAAYDVWATKAKSGEAVWNLEDKEKLRLGICRQVRSPPYGFSCRNDSHNKFPLAGASYKAIKDAKGSVVRLECETGCTRGVPKVLYDPGYEPEGNEPSVLEHSQAYERFRKACPQGRIGPN